MNRQSPALHGSAASRLLSAMGFVLFAFFGRRVAFTLTSLDIEDDLLSITAIVIGVPFGVTAAIMASCANKRNSQDNTICKLIGDKMTAIDDFDDRSRQYIVEVDHRWQRRVAKIDFVKLHDSQKAVDSCNVRHTRSCSMFSAQSKISQSIISQLIEHRYSPREDTTIPRSTRLCHKLTDKTANNSLHLSTLSNCRYYSSYYPYSHVSYSFRFRALQWSNWTCSHYSAGNCLY